MITFPFSEASRSHIRQVVEATPAGESFTITDIPYNHVRVVRRMVYASHLPSSLSVQQTTVGHYRELRVLVTRHG